MWESLMMICLVLALVNAIIAIIWLLVAIGVSSFLSKNESKIRSTDNKELDQIAEFALDELAKTHVIIGLLLKLGIIRNIVKNAVKKGAVEAIIKAIKKLRLISIVYSIISLLISIAGFAGFNMFYSMNIATDTAIAITNVLIKPEDTNIEEEEEGWTWESEKTSPVLGGDTESGGSNKPGNASGQYAIELDDGKYYWYHQASGCTGCDYDATKGDILTSKLNTSPNGSTMAGCGCSIYSTAMSLSNLLGQEITPITVIENVIGSEITGNSGKYTASTTGSSCIHFSTSGMIINKAGLAAKIEEAYGSQGVKAKAITVKNNQSEVDEILSKGGYIIASFNKMDFSWYKRSSAGSHYIVIRKKENDLYYCFNSTGGAGRPGHPGAVNSMTTGCTWKELNSALTHADGCAVWGEGIQYESTGGTGGGSVNVGINENVYNILASNSEFKGKAKTLAMVYDAATSAGLSHEFALGLMANVYYEGDFGMIEGIWTSKVRTTNKKVQFNCGCSLNGLWSNYYWPEVSCELHELLHKKSVQINQQTYNQLINIPKSTQGVGVGILQWSGSRRQTLLSLYAQNAGDWSMDRIQAVEIGMMIHELTQGSYSAIVKDCSGKSAKYCGEQLTKRYLIPADKTAYITRGNTAEKLTKLLGGN